MKNKFTTRDTIVFPDECRELTLPSHAPNFTPLGEIHVLLAGVSELTSGYEIARKTPKTHIVIFTIDGRGVFHSGDRKYFLEAGSFFVSPAGFSQHYFTEGKYWKKLWFHLEDCDYWSYLKKESVDLRISLDIAFLETAMRGFAREAISAMPESSIISRMYADIIASYLRRDLRHALTSNDLHIIKQLSKLWDIVQENLNHDWTLAKLSKMACMSPAHLSRVCNTHFQTSPLKMVTKFRMIRAGEFLKNSDWNLEVVAENVGYGNVFAFSTAFKRFHKVGPAAYRKA